MSAPAPDLWSFAWGHPQIDPDALAAVIEAELRNEGQDIRTKLLVRDGAEALERLWGDRAWAAWVASSPALGRIRELRGEDLGEAGFQFRAAAMVKATDPETVREYFRDLGSRITSATELNVGGAIPLILGGHLARSTHDINVVDEVPEPIRTQHALLRDLEARYRLVLTHFQSQDLPDGWSGRLRHVGRFRGLDVRSVDPVDIFVGKLFSRRAKDLDDLRALKTRFDAPGLVSRLRSSASRFLADDALRAIADRNWYVLFDEPLPDAEAR